jgi:hypothetical protein
MEYKPTHPLEPGAHSAPNEARRKQELERGQAIVLIAFVMVGLIAMLGLSVDGGGILFLYRDARNATDAATLSAAYALCTNGDVNNGYTTAADNGFDNNAIDNFVTIEWPPKSGIRANDYDYVNVKIRAFKPSYFIQVVYPEPLWISTEATGFCRKPFDSSTVGAIFGIASVCNNYAVDLTGADTIITGDVFSNQDTRINGANENDETSRLIVNGDLGTVGSLAIDKVAVAGASTDDEDPREDPFSWIDFDDYLPGSVIWEALETKGYGDYLYYKDASYVFDKKDGPFSGLYVVDGEVEMNGIEVDNTLGLTVIATKGIKILNAPKYIKYFEPLLTLNDLDIPSVGFIFYSEHGDGGCNNSKDSVAIDISLSTVEMTGVLYTPNGLLSASFADTTYRGALVGWAVALSGAKKEIIYTPELFPPQPPRVSIAQ